MTIVIVFAKHLQAFARHPRGLRPGCRPRQKCLHSPGFGTWAAIRVNVVTSGPVTEMACLGVTIRVTVVTFSRFLTFVFLTRTKSASRCQQSRGWDVLWSPSSYVSSLSESPCIVARQKCQQSRGWGVSGSPSSKLLPLLEPRVRLVCTVPSCSVSRRDLVSFCILASCPRAFMSCPSCSCCVLVSRRIFASYPRHFLCGPFVFGTCLVLAPRVVSLSWCPRVVRRVGRVRDCVFVPQ